MGLAFVGGVEFGNGGAHQDAAVIDRDTAVDDGLFGFVGESRCSRPLTTVIGGRSSSAISLGPAIHSGARSRLRPRSPLFSGVFLGVGVLGLAVLLGVGPGVAFRVPAASAFTVIIVAVTVIAVVVLATLAAVLWRLRWGRWPRWGLSRCRLFGCARSGSARSASLSRSVDTPRFSRAIRACRRGR